MEACSKSPEPSASETSTRLRYPEGRRFAFTIFDDTDKSTVENVGPVYELLADCGIRTTKSVWVLAPSEKPILDGSTLAEPGYADFIFGMKDKGFEIGLHNVTSHGVHRDVTQEGLEQFRRKFGHYPRSHTNHLSNAENMYWGAARLSGLACRLVYKAATIRRPRKFYGHVPASPYFWGDLCREHITYVRNFTFRDINVLNVNPTIPYHDPSKPYVKWWFSSTCAPGVDSFCEVLSPANQQRLEDEGGLCIIYTHFANGFVRDGVLNAEFRRLIEMLAGRNGWFVPVSTMLDWLQGQGRSGNIPAAELRAMERRWLSEKIRAEFH